MDNINNLENFEQTFEMNEEELLRAFPKVTSNTIKNKFKRAQEQLNKEGYILTKVKENGTLKYIVKTENTLQKNNYSILPFNWVQEYQNYEFGILLLLSSMPMRVYVGTFKDFFEMIYLKYSGNRLEKFKIELDELERKGIIFYKADPKNENRFMIAFSSPIEECLKLGIHDRVIKQCAQVAKNYNKRNFFQLVKVWIAVCYFNKLERQEVITVGMLRRVTGLSDFQVRDSLRTLFREDQLHDFGLQYEKAGTENIKCKGRNICENAITTGENQKEPNIKFF